jgi:hypothetical protein
MHYFMELRQGLQLAATWRKMEREGEREREERACGKLVGCIMYLSLYLLSWELFCHRNDFQVSRAILGMRCPLIYRTDHVFLGPFCRLVVSECHRLAGRDTGSSTSPRARQCRNVG